ncbi:nucleotide exchange factor GrpE [Synechococcus sp. GFB01]|uniref:nucleotide exchange factor GrpE n=1 Tax=Synechococcus sp. GFB01 TaxID=1662190 RepID=UPI00064F5C8A|nr:nucleotide exchange factor GrpE [Synechococcus sp. GFB01]KMM16684.1 molecular chaperone GrpE [Synechococcus sp. GFB01]KMM17760.1 molecular chaperone GrpE [Synechococcus sp. GFB01]
MSGDFPMDADTTPAEIAADQTVSRDSGALGDSAAPGLADASGDPAGSEAGMASSDDDRASRLEAELAALRADYDNLNGQYMRLAADFDNYRKRQSRDNEDQRLQIVCSTLSEILPVVDNFDRARQQLNPQHEEAQTLHRSYQGLYKQLVEVFKQLGVSPMRAEGEPFDPNLHEAVLREESHAHPEDIVIEELQRGYVLNDRVIRHALVKVSMGPGPGGVNPGPEAAATESAGAQPAGEEQAG